jgi:hypothetical protein
MLPATPASGRIQQQQQKRRESQRLWQWWTPRKPRSQPLQLQRHQKQRQKEERKL